MVNGAAVANGLSEAFGFNELGKAIGDRDALGVAVAAAGFLPAGKVARRSGDAAELILKYVGDDAVPIINEAGDLILQSKNGLREIRFDFRNPAPHKSPHVHVIEYKNVKNKKLETFNKRVYPSDVPNH